MRADMNIVCVKRYQTGVGMIEILITVVIIAVGLLGIAALQFMSKRANFEAVQRTTATMLAYDIIERMRANPGELREYGGSDTTPPAAVGGGTVAAPAVNCFTDPCSTFELYQFDLREWEQAIDGAAETNTGGAATGGLDQPTACITSAVAEGLTNRSGLYTVAIAWRGATEMANPVNPASPIPTPNPYTCGQATGKYDSESGTANTHRRLFLLQTYIQGR